MSEAIEDRAGGIGALGHAYFRRRYTILFYSLSSPSLPIRC
jgi:hypothetical protein